MSSLDIMTDEQFERHALEVLRRELGVDGLARFLRLDRSGQGDYTTDRTQWQKDFTVDEILDSIINNRRCSSLCRNCARGLSSFILRYDRHLRLSWDRSSVIVPLDGGRLRSGLPP